MHALETHYWWFAGRRALIASLLRAARNDALHDAERGDAERGDAERDDAKRDDAERDSLLDGARVSGNDPSSSDSVVPGSGVPEGVTVFNGQRAAPGERNGAAPTPSLPAATAPSAAFAGAASFAPAPGSFLPTSLAGSATHLLDIGCGTGANLPLLRAHVGPAGVVAGLDFSPLALRFARAHLDAPHADGAPHADDAPRTAGTALQFAKSANGARSDAGAQATQPLQAWQTLQISSARRNVALLQGDALRLPFCDAAFDIVTMLDVLEHLEDDGGALREVWRVLRPGGALVLSVPAYQRLWSAHDEALHHFRRYEKHALNRLLRQGGFRVQRLSFAMSLMPPAAWLWRRLILPFQPRRPRAARRHSEGAVLPAVPPLLNRALIAYLQAEGRVIAHRPLRFGTSLVAVACKPVGS